MQTHMLTLTLSVNEPLSHIKAYKWQETANVKKKQQHKTAKLDRMNVDV